MFDTPLVVENTAHQSCWRYSQKQKCWGFTMPIIALHSINTYFVSLGNWRFTVWEELQCIPKIGNVTRHKLKWSLFLTTDHSNCNYWLCQAVGYGQGQCSVYIIVRCSFTYYSTYNTSILYINTYYLYKWRYQYLHVSIKCITSTALKIIVHDSSTNRLNTWD